LQDVLSLGSEARMNVPSRSAGNWSWRYKAGALTSELARKLAALADVTDRAPHNVDARQKENPEEFVA